MFREVTESIEKRFAQEHILASRKNGALYQVTCIYEHRYIDISYYEDGEKKLRTITDIRIWRKR